MRFFQQTMQLRMRMVLVLCAALASGACLNSAVFAQPSTAKVPTTGRASPYLASFDRLLVGFLHERELPGAALAVARYGRLVYARGYGYADQETKEPVLPNSLFRIASVSKPLTAVAVLQLVERGRLRPDDSVFDVLQLEEPAENGVSFDECWRRVTILHLLQHRGGWDRDKSFDPMLRTEEPAGAIDSLMHQAADAVKIWPR
jgi:N-acyl-D-amino-acid deacylase